MAFRAHTGSVGRLRRRACLALLLAAGVGISPPASPAVAAESLDLETAISLALVRNRQLAANALLIARRRLDVTRARQEFDVRLKPDGSFTLSDSDAQTRYGMIATKKLPWGTELGITGQVDHFPGYVDNDWRSGVKVELRQPLFRNFGRLVQEQPTTVAGEQMVAEQRHWETQKADLILQLVDVFESIVRLQKQITADETILARIERLAELIRIRERQGRATRVETLRVELQLSQARSRLDSHREECYSAERDLAELVGADPDAQWTLVAPPLPEIETPAVAEAVAVAMRNRLDYAQLIDDLRASRRSVRIARRGLWPDVSLVAAREQFGEDDGFSDSLGLRRNAWQLGLAAELELNRGREQTDVAAAEVDADYAQRTVQIKTISITREVQQAISAYRRARTDLGSACRNYDIAESRAALARHLFEAGRGDNFAVSDAEQGFIDAEVLMLEARAAASTTGYRLLGAMGTLLEPPAELKPRPTEPAKP